MIVLALTGTRTDLGRVFLQRAAGKRGIRIVTLDALPPQVEARNISFCKIDLLDPAVHFTVGDILKKEKCNAFAHLAVFNTPTKDPDISHEINVIGTMKMLHACRMTGVKKFIYKSTALVYGAHPSNPALLKETHPCRPSGHSFIEDKQEAEKMVLNFGEKVRDADITILRAGFITGKSVSTFFSRYIHMKAVPVAAGYNPVIQVLHIADAVRAFEASISKKNPGIVNIAGDSPVPLLSLTRAARSVPVLMPRPGAHLALDSLWRLGAAPFPGYFLDYLIFPFLLDNTKMKKVLGVVPKYSTLEAVRAS